MDRDPKANPAAHQPSKAELEEDVSVDATPEALAWAVTRGGAEPRDETPQQQSGSATMTAQPDAASILCNLREAGKKMTAQDHREQAISYVLSLAGDDEFDARKEAEQCVDRMQGTAAK